MYKIYILVLLIIILFTNKMLSSNICSDLKLSLEIEKENYIPDESIYGEIKLINITNRVVEVNKIFTLSDPNSLRLVCVNEDGNIYTGYGIDATVIYTSEGIDLSPSGSIIFTFNLLHCFGEQNTEKYLQPYHLPENKYTIHAEFKPDPKFFMGDEHDETIKSESLIFIIKNKNLNYKEFQDHRILLNANNQMYKTKDIKQMIESCIEVINKYPESSYLDVAYSKIITLMRPSQSYNIEYEYDWVNKAIEKYNNHYFFNMLIRNRLILPKETKYSMNPADREYAAKLLENFIFKYKHSKGTEYIKYKQGNIKDIK